MSNISYQIIPFAFIFLMILFYLSLKNKKKKTGESKTKTEIIDNIDEKYEFLENAEKKLLALRDLYKQDLIESRVYFEKTELIAKSINKFTGKEISKFEVESNYIYEQLKNDINKKVQTISTKKVSSNLDKLISDVDKRIQTGLNYDR
ncbi:MAG: hypothetical protein ACJ0GH_01620 [Alphaproteobacteria bacterium]